MKITTVGIDLAKNVFQVHGVDEQGKAVLRKQLKRKEVASFFANLPALPDRHGSVRQRALLGEEARGVGPHGAADGPAVCQAVREDEQERRNDAEAICEAVARPNMRFVPVKTAEQQAVLALHRARQGFVKARTAQANQIRGLLAEFGIVIPQGHRAHRQASARDPGRRRERLLPGMMRQLLERLGEHLKELDQQVEELERQIKLWHRENEQSRKLEEDSRHRADHRERVCGLGGRCEELQEGRQVAAWLGMVPRQEVAPGARTLLGISKRGDVYLRTLLIHGARSVIGSRAQARSADAGSSVACPAQQEHRRGGAGGEERAHRLGAAGARAATSTITLRHAAA